MSSVYRSTGDTETLRIRPQSPQAPFTVIIGIMTICLVGCSRSADAGDAQAWTDLFEIGAPVAVSDSVLSILTTRLTDDQVARAARSLGHVPLAALRTGRLDSVFPGMPRGAFATTTVSGERLAMAMVPVPRLVLDTPYWPSIFALLAATDGRTVLVATNLLYRIFVYDEAGRLLDSLVDPPPSWRQARRPSLGEFPPDRRSEWNAYLRSFTVLQALAVVSESVVVVSHGRLAGYRELPFPILPTTLDVYVGHRRVAVDLPSPGELVAYSRNSLFFLRRLGSRDRTTLTEYVWRGSHE